MDLLDGKFWEVRPAAPPEYVVDLPSVRPILAQILYNRGLSTHAAQEMLKGSKPAQDDPSLMRDVDKAVDLIREVVMAKDSIVIYGDYDVDGITATAVLMRTLEAFGAVVNVYVPNRVDEGYGLNKEAIASLAEAGVRMMITVDCGVRSIAEVQLAKQLGMMVIITDHHDANGTLPPADAIINPKQPECQYPFKDFAGVGVAYKLAQALIRKNKFNALRTTRKELEETALLDMVALGTVADMVPLLGENHYLVAAGLERINVGDHPGLSALMQVAGVKPGEITAKTIGYNFSPRLNAAGRISDAKKALYLLLAEDMERALPLAKELDVLNSERRELTQRVRDEARAMVLQKDKSQSLIFAASDKFVSGVVGLAANRLVDEFNRPAVVISIEGEYSKGSARSIPEFHITEALDSMPDLLLVRHGGHPAAAGFTIKTEFIPELESRFYGLAQQQLEGLNLTPVFAIDVEIPLTDLSWDLYYELERLEPYGFGNPLPVFASRKVHVCNPRAVGKEGQHLKFSVEDSLGTQWDAIAFHLGYWEGRVPSYVDIAYVLERNVWYGNVSLQLNVKDIHFTG